VLGRWKKTSTIFSKKLKARNLQVKKKDLKLDGRGISDLLLHCLITFKVTVSVLHRFFLVIINTITLTFWVRVGLIDEEVVSSFEVDGLGRSLGLCINGNV